MRWSLRFTGRVQGVGFRATARGIARQHGLTGTVANHPDGSVIMQAQGQPHALEAALADIRATFAHHLRNVDQDEMPDRPGETSFEIER